MPLITRDEIFNSEVRALTWKEPFATAMLKGKTKESRTWWTEYRGLVLICSGLGIYTTKDLIETCGDYQIQRLSKAIGRNFALLHQETRGKAIGIARLTDVWCMDTENKDEDEAFVKFSSRLVIHQYQDAVRIKPFPFKGTQRWQSISHDQKELIELWPS